MAKDTHAGLAEKALSTAERHGQNLKAVNEKLADLVASLRDQKQRLSSYSHSGAPQAPGAEEVHVETSRVETDLAAELARAREALRGREREDARLRDRLAEIEAENRRVCDEFVAVQEQNAELVGLYAAVERLHGAPTRTEVLAAIQEIVINVVGSEEFVLFELTPDRRQLAPSHGFGVEARKLAPVAVGSGVVGRAVEEGKRWVVGEDTAAAREDPPLVACVPLKIGGDVAGAIAIYSFLGHKAAVTDFDHAIFELLERHAALALHLRAPGRAEGSR